MSQFESYLHWIHSMISIVPEDRQIYTNDYDIIRDYIMWLCKRSSFFTHIFKGTSLFGSHFNNVRINKPDEFDVIFELQFPCMSEMTILWDEHRPGFLRLDFEGVLNELEQNGSHMYDQMENLIDWNNNYLRRSNLQYWIEDLISSGLKEYGNTVRGCRYDIYKLEYSKRGIAHTIFAHCGARKISIDFIPAITMGRYNSFYNGRYYPFLDRCDKWFAIPKPTAGPKWSRKYTFMLCNPIAEHDLLLDKQNLKCVFRLLKSLRNEYEMRRLKSYFITTAFLWEIYKDYDNLWNQPIHILLVHMLDVLSDYFLEGKLPFFWNKKLNLLDILSTDEIKDYSAKLTKAYNVLSSYVHQPNLSLTRCLYHFQIPHDSEDDDDDDDDYSD